MTERTENQPIDHFKQAIHDLVHQSDISSKGIAERLGMSPQILINKANPNNQVNKMSVLELHAIQLLTGNDVVIRAMRNELTLHALKDAPISILEAMINTGKECGDVFARVQEAMADNKLTERERSNVLKEIREAIVALEQTERAVIAHGNTNY